METITILKRAIEIQISHTHSLSRRVEKLKIIYANMHAPAYTGFEWSLRLRLEILCYLFLQGGRYSCVHLQA